MHFRDHLFMSGATNKPAQFKTMMEQWQRDDFTAMDPALKYLAGIRAEVPPHRRFYRQRGRGHSKTSDTATSLTWALWAAKKRITGIVGAEDKKQAALVREQMETIARNNPWLLDRLDYQRTLVRNKFTGSEMQIMSRDVASSWGETHDFVYCDEFTHWTQPDFWSSLFSTFGKKESCVLIVTCNAGMGRGWHWQVREMARTSPLWHFSAQEGTLASWITKATLDEQRAALPINEFRRLWLNQWQETGGEFVTSGEVEACRDKSLFRRDQTQVDGWSYVAALDYAEKHDRTVGVVMHQENDTLVVDMMDVIDPRLQGQHTRVDWCRNWMRAVQRDFGGEHGKVYFVLDKYQLLGMAQDLTSEGFNIEFFEFGSGVGNWELSLILRQFILHQKLRWYPGCGAIEAPWGRDDLETELASLIVTNYANGRRWRFDHIQDDTHYDDRSFAVGAACWFFVKNSGGYDEWGFTPPERLVGFTAVA